MGLHGKKCKSRPKGKLVFRRTGRKGGGGMKK